MRIDLLHGWVFDVPESRIDSGFELFNLKESRAAVQIKCRCVLYNLS